MGRRTWESLPDRYRPLPGRTNIIVARTRAGTRGAEARPRWRGRSRLVADEQSMDVIGGG